VLLRRTTGEVSRPSPLLGAAGAAGAFAVVWAGVTLDGTDPFLYRGGSVSVALATAAVIAAVVSAPPRQALARVLSPRALRYVGTISYGLYLWHWPVMLVLTHARTGVGGSRLLAIRVAATFALAALSWHHVELPVRRGLLRGSRPALVLPAVAAVTAATLFVATVPGRVLPDRLFGAEPPVATVPVGFVRPAGPPIETLLLGDSVAFTYASALEAGHSYGIRVTTRTVLGCGVARTGSIRDRGVTDDPPRACARWPEWWRDLVATRRPDVVALAAGRWETYDRRIAGRWTHIGEPTFDTYLRRELERAITLLSSHGATVALLTAPYFQGVERPDGGRFPEDDPRRVDRFNQLLRDVAGRHPDLARVVEVGRVLSRRGRYVARIAGAPVRTRDGVHVTAAGRKLVAAAVLPELVAIGRARTLR
jgi:hypothetical protein